MLKKYNYILWMVIPVLLAGICMILVVVNDNQAYMPIPCELNFSGEYSYDGECWYPYETDGKISALDGNLILKGHFDKEIMEGDVLTFFCDHVGVSFYVNGERIYMDAPSEMKLHGMDLMPSMCGKLWKQTICPQISVSDEVEFRLLNYHRYGNKNAYQELLASCYITPEDEKVLECFLKPYLRPFRMLGNGAIIIAIMLLGAYIVAVILKSSMSAGLLKMGLATLFAGGYMIFDVMMVYLLDELLVVNTYGRQLCMMLAVYFLGLIICDSLQGNKKRVAYVVMGISGVVNVGLIAVVILGRMLMFDTQIYWVISQLFSCPVLMVLCAGALREDKRAQCIKWCSYILLLLAILLDISGVVGNRFYSGICTKIVFTVLLFVHLLWAAMHVIMEHQASAKNEKLQAELENSRIAVMLSQIQPHFLYNALTSVMDLCDSNPKQAKSAIADFADYLRGNLTSLSVKNPIPFEMELEHVKRYLRLEKLRFQDELNIVYDIKCEDFMIPSLSVQPLVENSVKHGVGKKVGGGTVTIRTMETEDCYIVQVEDDGVGFTVGEYEEDGKMHIGLENIRKRLEIMSNARLEVKSIKGKGTTAVILLKKRGSGYVDYGN